MLQAVVVLVLIIKVKDKNHITAELQLRPQAKISEIATGEELDACTDTTAPPGHPLYPIHPLRSDFLLTEP